MLARLLAGAEFRLCSLRLPPGRETGPHSRSSPGAGTAGLPSAAVFVIDLSTMPLEAEALMERIRSGQPRSRVLLVKETAQDDKVFPWLRMGARGIVRYADIDRDLATAVKAVHAGDFWVEPRQLARFIDWILAAPSHSAPRAEAAVLSRREREVLTSLLNGCTNKEIAAELAISERTVKFHVSQLLRKLGAQRRGDLMARQYYRSQAVPS